MNENHKRSVYHVREFELFKLSQISGEIDIVMSHDWPESVEQYGDQKKLLEIKPEFIKSIEQKTLGSPQYFRLLKDLKPKYWFSGHMHVYFTAIVNHLDSKFVEEKNLQINDNQQTIESPPEISNLEPKKKKPVPFRVDVDQNVEETLKRTNQETKFVALDKPLKNRKVKKKKKKKNF